LTKKDLPSLEKCYNRITDKTHGMFRRCKYEMMRFAWPKYKIIGFKKGRNVHGYIAFEYKLNKDENVLLHDINIIEMFCENREVLSQLLTWLNTQADQIRHIYFTNTDDNFHFIPKDPRDNSNALVAGINHRTNTQGVGLMYRITDIKQLFNQLKKHDFNGLNCRIKLNINDSFYKSNNGSYYLEFKKGVVRFPKEQKHDVEISMDISDFSSMVIGAVTFEKLYEYSLAEISKIEYVETVTNIFKISEQPYCVTQF